MAQLEIVIGVEPRQLPVVELLVDGRQLSDELHCVVLELGLGVAAGLRVEVPKGGEAGWLWDDGHGSLIEINGLIVSTLGGADLTQSSQGQVLVIEEIERGCLIFRRVFGLTYVEIEFAQLKLIPGHALPCET